MIGRFNIIVRGQVNGPCSINSNSAETRHSFLNSKAAGSYI